MRFLNRRKPGARAEAVKWEDDPADFATAMDYITGLSEEEYSKFVEVSVVYRSTYKKAAEILGKENKPTTTIDCKRQDYESAIDDDLAAAFLEDEPVKK